LNDSTFQGIFPDIDNRKKKGASVMAAAEKTLQPQEQGSQESQLQQFVPGQRKDLYHVVQGTGRNRHWRKFGAGFVNKDGSINIVIDLFPNAHFQLRDPNARDTEEKVTDLQVEAQPETVELKIAEPESTESKTQGKGNGKPTAKTVLKEAVKKGK
jgi:hypothetical protein